MPRTCPKCRSLTLDDAEGTLADLSPQEHALFCSKCRGYWMPHAVVERWQTEPFVEITEDEPMSVRPDPDKRTGLCPMGHGILLRARVDSDKVYYLERCGLCRGVWLDRGEWQRLAAALYLDHLDDLWDPTWQKQRRREALQKGLDVALVAQIGPELFAQVSQVVHALLDHPAKAQAFAWIAEHLDPDE